MTAPVAHEKILKSSAAETPLDLILFRPVALLFVQLARPTPLGADGMTVLSIILGLAGASLFRFQSSINLIVGAALLLLYAILNRAGAELERAQVTPSRLGRIRGGLGDYLVGAASAVTISIHITSQSTSGVWLAIGGIGSAILQGAVFENVKARYLTMTAAQAERAAPIARALAYLGSSTHVALLAIFACARALPAYLWLRLTLGNVLLAALYFGLRPGARPRAR